MEFTAEFSDGTTQSYPSTLSGHGMFETEVQTKQVVRVAFNAGCPSEETQYVVFNFKAALSKAHKFLQPHIPQPFRNPWQQMYDGPPMVDTHVVVQFARPLSGNLASSIVWRMANTFEWCHLPNRVKLSSPTNFSRETWDNISVYLKEETLKRPISENDDRAQDPELVASDHQSQTDAVE